jgi:hypothetical protein
MDAVGNHQDQVLSNSTGEVANLKGTRRRQGWMFAPQQHQTRVALRRKLRVAGGCEGMLQGVGKVVACGCREDAEKRIRLTAESKASRLQDRQARLRAVT